MTKHEVDSTQNRFLFIDGLRGIAATAVAGFHFYNGSPLKENLSNIIPTPISIMLEHGYLGVEIFFVISGFVMAYSLRNASITPRFFANFILRRALRLTPPYWTVILLTILANVVSNFVLRDRSASIPSPDTILAHLFYLQDILKLGQILPTFWTLCIEIQFYLLFIFLLKCISHHNFLKTRIILMPLAFISLAIAIRWIDYSMPGLFLPWWYIFFMGVIISWTQERCLKSIWFYLSIVILTLALVLQWDIRVLVTLVISLTIYFSNKYEQLHNCFNINFLQYLGKISYSFYLIHALIGMRIINIGYRINNNVPILALVWFIFAFLLSIIIAHLMYFYIEKPSINFSKRFKMQVH